MAMVATQTGAMLAMGVFGDGPNLPDPDKGSDGCLWVFLLGMLMLFLTFLGAVVYYTMLT